MSVLYIKNSEGSGSAASSNFGSVQTSAVGATYVALAAQACTSVSIINNTGTSLDVTKNDGASKIVVPTGAAFCVDNITNASSVKVRRTDQSNTQVTAYYVYSTK